MKTKIIKKVENKLIILVFVSAFLNPILIISDRLFLQTTKISTDSVKIEYLEGKIVIQNKDFWCPFKVKSPRESYKLILKQEFIQVRRTKMFNIPISIGINKLTTAFYRQFNYMFLYGCFIIFLSLPGYSKIGKKFYEDSDYDFTEYEKKDLRISDSVSNILFFLAGSISLLFSILFILWYIKALF